MTSFLNQYIETDHQEVDGPPVEVFLPPVEVAPEQAIEIAPAPAEDHVTACTPRNLVSALFSARDKAVMILVTLVTWLTA